MLNSLYYEDIIPVFTTDGMILRVIVSHQSCFLWILHTKTGWMNFVDLLDAERRDSALYFWGSRGLEKVLLEINADDRYVNVGMPDDYDY